MKRKRDLVGALFLIVCCIGFLAWSLVHQELPFDVEVTYTAKGFDPSILGVPLGTRVAFRNKSKFPMWPASDPHPTHTDYPEFDAKKDYLPGQTYVFQFERYGVFGFHNHERSSDRGTIRVSDPDHPLPNIDKTKINQQAQRNKLLAMLDPKDPQSIFKVFDAISAHQSLSINCHDIAHDLGHRAYQLYGFSQALAINNPERLLHTPVEDICAGGYMHGILEELFLEQPDRKADPGAMCEDIPKKSRSSCFHGVGHALMFVNKRNVNASLDGCRSLGNTHDVSSCFEGVWMELFWGNTDHVGPNALGWDSARPLDPCVRSSVDAKYACFLYASLGYLRTNSGDFPGALRLCTQTDLTDRDQYYCLKGIGITMMSNFKGKNLEQAASLASGLDTTQKSSLYEGLMGYAQLSGMNGDALLGTCELFQEDKDLCVNAVAAGK